MTKKCPDLEPADIKFDLKPALIAGTLVLGLWVLNFVFAVVAKGDDGGRGTLGDAFGISNALFSGLALAGVIYAIWLQRAEIKLTKAELAYTKRIFQEQSDSLKLQNAETKKQIFENTFFQLLRLFTDVTAALKVGDGANPAAYLGKDIFDNLENQLARTAKGLRATFGSPPSTLDIYHQLYMQRQNELGHYFRTLYNILKFVDHAKIDNQKFYTNIVRAQLSNSELHLLLYNGLSNFGAERLKPLLERYEFFDNLPVDRVMYPDVLSQYEISAFGSNQGILGQIEARDA